MCYIDVMSLFVLRTSRDRAEGETPEVFTRDRVGFAARYLTATLGDFVRIIEERTKGNTNFDGRMSLGEVAMYFTGFKIDEETMPRLVEAVAHVNKEEGRDIVRIVPIAMETPSGETIDAGFGRLALGGPLTLEEQRISEDRALLHITVAEAVAAELEQQA